MHSVQCTWATVGGWGSGRGEAAGAKGRRRGVCKTRPVLAFYFCKHGDLRPYRLFLLGVVFCMQ